MLTRESIISHQAKTRKEEKNLSPRNMKACHSISNCPHAKRRGDRNPKYHGEQQKQPPQTTNILNLNRGNGRLLNGTW
jgi:hypothetical protein